MIADPAIDIGMLLYNYVPEKNWSDWFKTYGVEENIELNKRMKWYTVIQSEWFSGMKNRKRFKDMNNWLKFLNEVMNSNLFI